MKKIWNYVLILLTVFAVCCFVKSYVTYTAPLNEDQIKFGPDSTNPGHNHEGGTKGNSALRVETLHASDTITTETTNTAATHIALVAVVTPSVFGGKTGSSDINVVGDPSVADPPFLRINTTSVSLGSAKTGAIIDKSAKSLVFTSDITAISTGYMKIFPTYSTFGMANASTTTNIFSWRMEPTVVGLYASTNRVLDFDTSGNTTATGTIKSKAANAFAAPASGYLNFGATLGTSGYGIRDNSGSMEFKNSGGAWTAVPAAATLQSAIAACATATTQPSFTGGVYASPSVYIHNPTANPSLQFDTNGGGPDIRGTSNTWHIDKLGNAVFNTISGALGVAEGDCLYFDTATNSACMRFVATTTAAITIMVGATDPPYIHDTGATQPYYMSLAPLTFLGVDYDDNGAPGATSPAAFISVAGSVGDPSDQVEIYADDTNISAAILGATYSISVILANLGGQHVTIYCHSGSEFLAVGAILVGFGGTVDAYVLDMFTVSSGVYTYDPTAMVYATSPGHYEVNNYPVTVEKNLTAKNIIANQGMTSAQAINANGGIAIPTDPGVPHGLVYMDYSGSEKGVEILTSGSGDGVYSYKTGDGYAGVFEKNDTATGTPKQALAAVCGPDAYCSALRVTINNPLSNAGLIIGGTGGGGDLISLANPYGQVFRVTNNGDIWAPGSIEVEGTATATQFVGGGAGITNVDAATLGSYAYNALPYLPLSGGTMSGALIVNNNITATGTVDAGNFNTAGTVTATQFSGGGAGLTGVTITDNGGNSISNINDVSAATFTGDGSALTGLNIGLALPPSLQHTNCAVVAMAPITLSGEQTIDGVLTSSSRVLAINETLPASNGIYISAAGAWSRATDMDTAGEAAIGNWVIITGGTLKANHGYYINTAPTVIDVDPIVFADFTANGVAVTDSTKVAKAGDTMIGALIINNQLTIQKETINYGVGSGFALTINPTNSAGSGISISKANSTSGTKAIMTNIVGGSGIAGEFDVGSNSSTNDAIYSSNNGLGETAHFYATNSSNTSDIILGNTLGTGNLLTLQRSAVTKMSVSNAGVVDGTCYTVAGVATHTGTVVVKGSDGNNCNLVYSCGQLMSTTCP